MYRNPTSTRPSRRTRSSSLIRNSSRLGGRVTPRVALVTKQPFLALLGLALALCWTIQQQQGRVRAERLFAQRLGFCPAGEDFLPRPTLVLTCHLFDSTGPRNIRWHAAARFRYNNWQRFPADGGRLFKGLAQVYQQPIDAPEYQ
jgi:hypothetical protein